MSDLTAVSLFAGIGGIDRALELARAKVTAAVEIDPDCREILRRHFPDAAIFNDVTEVTGDQLRAAGFVPERGILAGGFPCQGLSVAGLRKGLADARSGLFWHVMRLADELRPRWLLLENVPGLLSAVCPCPGDGTCVDNGRAVECGEWRAERVPGPADELTGDDCFVCGHSWDFHDAGGFCSPCQGTCEGLPEVRLREVFVPNVPHNIRKGACPAGCMAAHGGAMGTVLGALGERGYGFAYRVLDAQFFGVPQRRRRVFIAGCLGDRAAPVQVLLEPESGEGNPAEGRAARSRSARAPGGGAVSALQGGGRRGHRIDAEGAAGGHLVPEIAYPLVSEGNDRHDESQMTYVPVALRGREGGSQIEAGEPGEPAFTVRTPGGGSSLPMVAHAITAREAKGADSDATSDFIVAAPLTAGSAAGKGVNAPGWRREDDINLVTHALTSEGADASEDGTGRGTPLVAVPVAWRGRGMEAGEEGVANAIRSGGDGHTGDQMGYVMTATATGFNTKESRRGAIEGLAPTLRAESGDPHMGGRTAVAHAHAVRRLTPLECERLQGFPDRWTLYQADGSEQSDSTRYRQLGNSVAVPCVAWITRRIAAVEAASEALGAA